MTTQPTLLPPGAISVVAADSSLTLRWGASASPEVVAYRIYRRNPDGSWPAQPMEGSTHTEYVDLEVKNGQVYAYRIASVDAAGNMSMAQEASGTPVGAVAESKTLPLKTAILAGIIVALVAGFGAYSLGHSSGEKSGEEAGQSSGYKAGVTKGSGEVAAQYAKGANGYKRIYDAGYSAGSKSGKAAGAAAGKRKGEEVGFEKGKAAGETQGKTIGAEDAYKIALGGYSTWQPALPYLINVKGTGDTSVPYGVSDRHPMQIGYDYYVCTTGTGGVCRSTSK